MKNPFSVFMSSKPKEPLTTEELTTQRACYLGSRYQDYFGRHPTLSDVYEMRQDPTIKIGLSVIKHPLQRVEWTITKSPSAKQPLPTEIKDFVDGTLRPLWDEFMVNLLAGIEFGYLAFEKVWDYQNGKLYYEKLVPLRPDNLEVYYDPKTGEFTRVIQIIPPTAKKKETVVEIPAEKLFVYTHKKEFGNVEGESRLLGVYPYWRMCNDIYKYSSAFYHRMGVPLVRGWCPQGTSPVTKDDKGNPVEVDNMTWWANILENMHNSTTIVHEYTDDDRWGLEFMEPKVENARFLPYIEHLNIMKLVALFVPELTVMKGVRGSYSLGREQTDLFLDNEEAILKEIKGQIDEYLIKPLVDKNFPNAPSAHWEYQPISKQIRSYMYKVFELVSMSLANRGFMKIDYNEIAERLGIPHLEEQEEFPPLKSEEGMESEEELEARERIKGLHPEITLAEKKTVAQWRSKVDRLSGKLAKDIGGIYDFQIQALLIKIKDILGDRQKGNVGSRIRKLRVPNVAKFANMLYIYILEALDVGKRSVAEELGVDYDKAVPDNIRNMLRARADAVADRHASDLLYLASLTVLDNLPENVTEKDILKMVMTEFDNFKSKKIPVTSRHELMNSFTVGRSYVADKNIIR